MIISISNKETYFTNMMKIIVNTIVVNLKSTRVYQKLKNNPNFENPNYSIEVFTPMEKMVN
jgi:hypothetical protein